MQRVRIYVIATALGRKPILVAIFREAYIGTFERAILAETDFKGAHIDKGLICRGQNLIWNTIMPDGQVVRGPQWGNGRDAR